MVRSGARRYVRDDRDRGQDLSVRQQEGDARISRQPHIKEPDLAVSSADAGAAPLVVLIHGFAASKDLGVIPKLFERIARSSSVISFDLPGHGASPGRFEDVTFPLLDRSIDSMLDTASKGRPMVLVGHSMGGVLAYRAAARRTDIAGCVLLAPGFSITSRFLLDLKRRAERDGFASFEERGREYRVSEEFFASRSFDPFELAPHISVPVLIVMGELDYTVDGAFAQRVASSLEKGSFFSAANEGHDLSDLSYWPSVASFIGALSNKGRGI